MDRDEGVDNAAAAKLRSSAPHSPGSRAEALGEEDMSTGDEVGNKRKEPSGAHEAASRGSNSTLRGRDKGDASTLSAGACRYVESQKRGGGREGGERERERERSSQRRICLP